MLLVCILLPFGWARQFDKEDQILKTQTNPVPVTKEMLNNDKHPGAPAPTYKLIHDSDQFLTSEPVNSATEEALRSSKDFKPKLADDGLPGEAKESTEDDFWNDEENAPKPDSKNDSKLL